MSASAKLRILTTSGYPLRPQWASRADVVTASSPPTLVRELLAGSSSADAVVLSASVRGEQVAAAIFSSLRPRVPMVLQDATWKRGTGRLGRIGSAVGLRLIDGRRTHFCVLSEAEAELFPHTWGVDPERVHVTPWYYGLSDAQLNAPVEEGDFVFAGGDSLRDYRPLIDAARSLAVPVRIAARSAPPVPVAQMPANVDYRALTEQDYALAMRSATIVVVALTGGTERSAGQNNYLNPMALGKLVIVAESIGVREYVEPGVTGLVVPAGDPGALARAIAWAVDPANADEVRAIAARGRKLVLERFTPDHYVDRLLEVVSAAVGPGPGPGSAAASAKPLRP